MTLMKALSFSLLLSALLSFDNNANEVTPIDDETIATIQTTLEEIYATDQAFRQKIGRMRNTEDPDEALIAELWRQQSEVDAYNQQLIVDLVDQHGWPEYERFDSFMPARTILLVIQHADIELQLQYFNVIEKAYQTGNLEPSFFALFYDRVRVRQGEEQLYGTQLFTDPETGEPAFRPIQQPEELDARRAQMGLSPIAEYAAIYGIEFNH